MTRSRRSKSPPSLFPSPSTEGSAWFQERRRAALDRPATVAHLRCLAAVPDFVAERCAECGAPFNRPLGSDLDRCTGCAHASMVAEFDELEEAKQKIERDLATASDRVEELAVALRAIREAVKDCVDDPLARIPEAITALIAEAGV